MGASFRIGFSWMLNAHRSYGGCVDVYGYQCSCQMIINGVLILHLRLVLKYWGCSHVPHSEALTSTYAKP